MATATEINEIVKLYVGYYNRAPDPVGLNFWINAFDNGFSLDAMAVDFSTQAETLQNYPFFLNANPSVEELATFVDSIYMNLFNRAPDDAGRAFWSTKIESGEFSVGEAISLIIEGATTEPDSLVVANKVIVGVDFYIDANAQPEYQFDADDIAAATAIQASVTEDPATIDAAKAQTDSYIAGLNASIIVLSDFADGPGDGGFGVDTQGSASNDVYSATIFTLQDSDNIAAGSGTDTLNIRVPNDVSAFGPTVTVTPTATGLEKITITSQQLDVTGGGQYNLDLTNVSGVTDVTAQNSGAIAGVGFTSMDEGTLVRMVNYDGFLGTNFDGDRGASTDDAFNLYVENSGTEAQSAIFRVGNDDFSTDGSFETANIEIAGAETSFLDADEIMVDTINVTGSGSLNLKDSFSSFAFVKAIDASALTGGGINLTVDAARVANFAFTGSEQDDTLISNIATLNGSATLSLNGGGGTDTIRLDTFDGLSTTYLNASTGFEVLRSTGNTTTLDAGSHTAMSIFAFAGQTGEQLVVNNLSDGDRFVFETDFVGTVDDMLRFRASEADQSLTLELKASESTGGEIRIANETNSLGFTDAIDFQTAGISSVEIVSSGSNDNANVISSINTGAGNGHAISNSSGPSAFTITGSQALTITAEEGVSLSASSTTSGFQISATVDGSAATGNLRIAGSNSDDTIMGGSGNDILYGLGGTDALTGNEGMDQFRVASDTPGKDTIVDFTSGQDMIGILDGMLNNTTATAAGATVAAADYVDNLETVGDMNSSEANRLVELQNAATTAQLSGSIADGSATNAFVLAFNQTTGRGELWFDDDWSDTADRSVVADMTNVTDLAQLVGLSNTDFVEYVF